MCDNFYKHLTIALTSQSKLSEWYIGQNIVHYMWAYITHKILC